MIRVWLVRAVLIATPFVVWFVWTRLTRGSQRRPPPWPWLLLAGVGLVAASTGATVLLSEDNRGEVYVPAEMLPDGGVEPGRFEEGQER